MKPKFTPGPWRLGKTGDSVVSDSCENLKKQNLTDDSCWKYYDGHLVAESISPGNRQLVQIAPEMYDLLSEIAELNPCIRNRIEKTLIKANLDRKSIKGEKK